MENGWSVKIAVQKSRAWTSAFVLIGLIMVAAVASVWIARVQTNDEGSLQARVLSIAAELHAPGDQNTMTAATSTLDTAQHMRYEIQQDILSGMTREQVIQDMQKEYGADVLAAPAARGFGSLAWIAPWLFLVILVGSAWIFARRKQASMPNRRMAPSEAVLGAERGDGAEDMELRNYL